MSNEDTNVPDGSRTRSNTGNGHSHHTDRASNNTHEIGSNVTNYDENTNVNEHFDNIRHYNLEPTVVPPYVLDSVAKAHHKEAQEMSNMPNDLFLSSINNNWNNFLSTIESKSSNLLKGKVVPLHPKQGLVQSGDFDDITLKEYKLPDLSGSWEGDERLKKILNEESYGTNNKASDGFSNTRFLSFFRKPKNQEDPDTLLTGNNKKLLHYQKNLLEGNDDSPKQRSSAKYWMSTEQRGRWKPALKSMFLFNPYLLVTLRTIMFVLCVIALGLASSIYQKTKSSGIYNLSQQPSTIMAICVQSIALVYLVYITWDEYSGKPLGLRDPMGKIRLILFDLLFIIFGSANLSLAYNTLFDDRWVCVRNSLTNLESDSPAKREPLLQLVSRAATSINSVKISSICDKQRALSAFLFILLCLWVFTFTISIFRVVERVSSPKS